MEETKKAHVPVLLNEVIESFSSLKDRSDLVYVDGTFGRGGHFEALQNKYKIVRAIACDQDLEAITYGKAKFPNVEFHHENFLNFAEKNQTPLDMVLLDLGVSSPQLDQSERGFSFNKDGPLDMRMNQNGRLTAKEIINEFSAEELEDIFKVYGEVQRPGRVIRAIVSDRIKKPFENTLELAGLIERVDGWTKKGFHPATQYFMALRLAVNNELGVVEKSIPLFISQLRDGGVLSVISFHSLEDRIVKNLFKDSEAEEIGYTIHKKVIVPTEEECKINPRARSAKLRVFCKGKMPEKPDKFALRRMGLR